MIPLAPLATFMPLRSRTRLTFPDSIRSLRTIRGLKLWPGRACPLSATMRKSCPEAMALKRPRRRRAGGHVDLAGGQGRRHLRSGGEALRLHGDVLLGE